MHKKKRGRGNYSKKIINLIVRFILVLLNFEFLNIVTLLLKIRLFKYKRKSPFEKSMFSPVDRQVLS